MLVLYLSLLALEVPCTLPMWPTQHNEMPECVVRLVDGTTGHNSITEDWLQLLRKQIFRFFSVVRAHRDEK